PDPELRAVAVEALASRGRSAAMRVQLRESLADESSLVRGAAARALLQWRADDETHEAAGSPAMLQAYVAAARQNWAEGERPGPAALPALAATARDPDPAIRREARWMAALLIRRRAPAESSLRGAGGRRPRPMSGRAAGSTRARGERRAPA